MQVEQQILVNSRLWCQQTGHSEAWVATQLVVSPRRLQQYFNGRYLLSTSQIEQLVTVTGQSVSQLTQLWSVGGSLTVTTSILAAQQARCVQLTKGVSHDRRFY